MNAPKVSVVVPVYNVDAFLAKCLETLVHQTLRELEILIVDDGSTDGSAKIIKTYQQKFPQKIRCFQQENRGISTARNLAVDHAYGDYIGFVDSDDYVEPGMFQDMYDLAVKHGADMVICNLQKVNEKGIITQKLPQLPHLPEKIRLEEHFSAFSDLSYFACNKLFHKDLFKQNRFKPGVHFEDIQLIPQQLLQCRVIAHTSSYHYQYVERANSITKEYSEKGLDILAAVRDVEVAFEHSEFAGNRKELKDFQILEGVYSFLAYLAFVKDEGLSRKMSRALAEFCKLRKISLRDVLSYRRFGKNYLLSLPLKKKVFYGLYFGGAKKLLRKISVKYY